MNLKKKLKSMLSLLLIIATMAATGSIIPLTVSDAAFDSEEWYDQITTVHVNRENPRAFFIPYQNAATALDNEASAITRDFERSDYYKSLNGDWKFKVVDKPDDRIDNFWSMDASMTSEVATWDDIPVPSNWQTIRNPDGSIKYDHPIYINTRYPWRTGTPNATGGGGSVVQTHPVKAPIDFNPVGHYRRTFEIPSNWDGREVFISFQGVESCFYLWINGIKVGYATDSYTASEFNLTKYLQPGVNTIAVQVYRWSIGSYLENQDFFRLSGILRDVFLFSKDKVELNDFFVTPDLDANFENGSLKIEAKVRNFGAATGAYTVEATLKNMDDTNVWTDGPLVIPFDVAAAGTEPWVATATVSKAVTAPRLWFAETPNLYKLLFELKDPSGKVIETAAIRVGFRKLDRVVVNANGNQILRINGKRIMIRGTNRHEFSLENGRAITKAEILEDLLNMKRNNINAIRTSHYPNNVLTYAFADELGIYMCDETNLESHEGAQFSTQTNRIPGTTGANAQAWRYSVLDRTMNMVEQHKNFPSIIIWSLGNEFTYSNWPALADPYPAYLQSRWIRSRDPSRMIKYERDNRSGLVDIRSEQYPGATSARSRANSYTTSSDTGAFTGVPFDNKLPYLLSEYSHDMGNAGGGFYDYWQVFREVPQAQGGFIWDYIDQALWLPVPASAVNPDDAWNNGTYHGYGGDFGERFHDNDFSGNGIMFADRSPKPFLNEVRYNQQEVWYTASQTDLAAGKINISNEFLNRPLSDFVNKWYIIKDGVTIDSGELELTIAPLTKQDVIIPAVLAIVPEPGAEYFLKLDASLKTGTIWADAGHVIATEQFKLPISVAGDLALDLAAVPKFTGIINDTAKVEVTGADFSITFDKSKAELSSLKKNGIELISRGPYINHWRSTGSNDLPSGTGAYNNTFGTSRWNNVTSKTVTTQVDPYGRFIKVQVASTLSNNASNTTIYTLFGNGEVAIDNTLRSTLGNYLLRVGMKMQMAPGFDNFTFYGKGPGENYSDRQSGSPVGVYQAKTQDMYTPYLRPQFYGNRMDVRWFSVTDENGNGLLIDAKSTINACASNYDEDDFGTGHIVSTLSATRVHHLFEVPKRDGAVLNIDMVQAPVGCWGGWNGERAPIALQVAANGTHRYTYRIIPIVGATTAANMAESKRDFDVIQDIAQPQDYGILYASASSSNAFVNVNSESAAMLLVAAYNERGLMIALKSTEIAKGFNSYSLQMDVAGAYVYRAFVWDEDYVPLYAAKSF